ncbi:hypothetical protein Tco_0968912 [Tanacetum coccineum]
MDKCKIGLGYNVVPPPYTGNFMPPKLDLVYPSLDDFVDVNKSVSESIVEKHTVETNEPKTARKENEALIIEDWVSDSDAENVPKVKIVEMFNKTSFAKINFVKSTEQVNTVKGTRVNTARPKAVLSAVKGNKGNAVKASACWVWRPKHKVLDHGNPQQDLKDKGVIDSGCSWHMIGNRSYLIDYEEIDRGFVAFGGNSKEGKITGKGYFTNSKAFRVFNSRTRIVEKNLHVQFSENTPNIARSKPNWIFDIDALTNSMNFKPVVAGNQFNGNVGTKACADAGKARVETVHGKNYILLPLWTQDPPFSSSLKDSPDAGFKPPGEEEKKDAKDLGNEGGNPSEEGEKINQEKDASVNSTNNINTVSPTVNAANIKNNAVDENIVYGCTNDPNINDLEEISRFSNAENDDSGADINNLDTYFQVSPVPTTRIHKDHPLN